MKPGWLARAVVSGYFASTMMLLMAMLSYAFFVVVAQVNFGHALALTQNTLTTAVKSYPYLAVGAHYLVGLALAVLYAARLEPRAREPWWRLGLKIGGGLYAFSFIIFSSLIFALRLEAGPYPLIGNLLLHLGYALTLTGLYKLFTDAELNSRRQALGLRGQTLGPAPHPEQRSLALRASSRNGVRGIVAGTLAGLAVSALALWACAAGSRPLLNFPVSWVYVSGAMLGSALGCLIGVISGEERRPRGETRRWRGEGPAYAPRPG